MELTQNAVYRVNWLRAKARHDRWVEEISMLKSEMGWTINYFDHEKKVWGKRAEQSGGKEGHVAYALKQSVMWDRFGQDARTMVGCYSEQ